MFTYLIKGGPVMIPILICSLAAGTLSIIYAYRLWQLSRLGWPEAKLKEAIDQRKWSDAYHLCKLSEHPFLLSWQIGFRLLYEGTSDFRDIEETVSIEGAKTVAHFETQLNRLAALITILPMLGFLGTILGLITSFQNWEHMGAQVSVSALAGGIYQAMITTAAGLIAAIPYHLLHHYFASRTQLEALKFSTLTAELFRRVKEALLQETVPNPDSVLTNTND